MQFEPIPHYEYTKAITIPDDPKIRKTLVDKLLAPYKFSMLMGLSCCGKSTFLDSYTGRVNWSLTKWNRDNVFNMVFQDGTRVEKFYGYMNEFEGRLFPELFNRDTHQVVVEGWNLVPSGRTRYMNYFTKSLGRSAIFVFDGPVEEIVKRNQEAKRLYIPENEVEIFIRNKYNGTVWPTFDEGWDDIYYINTFGGRGTRYLQKKL